jgi:hypothetical protein
MEHFRARRIRKPQTDVLTGCPPVFVLDQSVMMKKLCRLAELLAKEQDAIGG